jgi:hypothetical protein
VRVDRYVSAYCGWSTDNVHVAETSGEEQTLMIIADAGEEGGATMG